MSGDKVIVIGAGIGGLALSLALHKASIEHEIIESVSEIKPVGVGINLLPHAMASLNHLGVVEEMERRSIATKELCYYTRFGQFVNKEPRGRYAGYEMPQLSIHRADIHEVLLNAVRERMGADKVQLGRRCVGATQNEDKVFVHVQNDKGQALPDLEGTIAVACDGVHSALRKQMHPVEAVPRYEGTTMYRGVTRWQPFLSGSSMVYLGTQKTGKLVVYPVRHDIDEQGRQLINWVIEIEHDPQDKLHRDWNRQAKIESFIQNFEDCSFDWLDIPAFLRASDVVLEYPMVDQEPLPFWTQGRLTLLGDAAHPMMPRGSNGAAQAVFDAITLTDLLASTPNPLQALKLYEDKRLPATSKVVLANRSISPDAILQVVEDRSGGKPFNRIEDILPDEEFKQWQDRYRELAGFNKAQVHAALSAS